MAHCKTTASKKVVFEPLDILESMRQLLERPQETHCDGKNAGYFLRTLKWMPAVLGYHDAPLYFGKQTPLGSRGCMQKVHVVLYEKPMTDGICRIHHIHHASDATSMFNASIQDSAHEALMSLCNENAQTL
jgi:hypothetical protein